MNTVLNRYCWLVLPFVLVLESSAASYYVDFTSGSDANAGTSTGAAFKRCPGDANATGTAASTVLAAGDTVFFKGGVNYEGKVLLKSGSPGSRIVYDGNSVGTWGTGKAVFNFTNHPTVNIAFNAASSVSNFTIKNFEFTEIGGYHVNPAATGCSPSIGTAKSGAGVYLYDFGCMDALIENCYFHEIGEWQPIDPFEDGVIQGAGISLQNGHRITISGCEFTRMHTGIEIKVNSAVGTGTSDITITNCNMHNYIAWGIDMAGRAANCTLSNIVVINSDFHDYQEYDLGQWAGCGERPHTDGIFIRNVYTGQNWAGWNRIDGCRFYNTNAVGGGSACISITEGPSFDIVNNLFMNTVHGRVIYLHNGRHPGDAPQTNNIWNNTFWNDHTSINLTRGGFDLGWVSVMNNIFYDTRTGSGANFIIYSEENFASCRPDVLDYNLYLTFNTAGGIWQTSGLGELTFAGLKGLGFEAHGLTSDPLFVDRTQGVGINILNNDLRLRSASPCIGAGTNLSRFFTWDYSGASRALTGAWTIGARSSSDGRPEPAVDLRRIGP